MSQALSSAVVVRPAKSQHSPSFFNRIGYSVGKVFSRARNATKATYLEASKGFNKRLEAEEIARKQQVQSEIDKRLSDQAVKFKKEFTTYAKKRTKQQVIWTLLVAIAAFVGGFATVFFNYVV